MDFLLSTCGQVSRTFIYVKRGIPLQELIDLLDAIIGDLREFESEGYPAYLKQVKR